MQREGVTPDIGPPTTQPPDQGNEFSKGTQKFH